MIQHAARIAATEKTTSWMMAAGDQMVVERGTMPIVLSRKWPWVATSSGALAERPYCQSAEAAVVMASRNGKSMAISWRSASAAK